MKKKLIVINYIFLIVFISGCEKKHLRLESKEGFPEMPMNLSIFNSEYDDYNSDLEPGVYDINTFTFSSNRNSQGKEFDIMLYSNLLITF